MPKLVITETSTKITVSRPEPVQPPPTVIIEISLKDAKVLRDILGRQTVLGDLYGELADTLTELQVNS